MRNLLPSRRCRWWRHRRRRNSRDWRWCSPSLKSQQSLNSVRNSWRLTSGKFRSKNVPFSRSSTWFLECSPTSQKREFRSPVWARKIGRPSLRITARSTFSTSWQDTSMPARALNRWHSLLHPRSVFLNQSCTEPKYSTNVPLGFDEYTVSYWFFENLSAIGMKSFKKERSWSVIFFFKGVPQTYYLGQKGPTNRNRFRNTALHAHRASTICTVVETPGVGCRSYFFWS